MAKNESKESETDIIIGNALKDLLSSNENNLNKIAQNLQKQIERKEQMLENLKNENANLKTKIDHTNNQTKTLFKERGDKTTDLFSLNKYFENKNASESVYSELLSTCLERHKDLLNKLDSFKFSENSNNNFDLAHMDNDNKKWQKQIKNLTNLIKNNLSDLSSKLYQNELNNRKNELVYLRKCVEANNFSETQQLFDNIQQRNEYYKQNANSQDQGSNEFIQDSDSYMENFKNLVSNLNEMGSNKWYKKVNTICQQELEDRVSDLRELKDIFIRKFDQKLGEDKLHSMFEDFSNNIANRHTQNEQTFKQALPVTSNSNLQQKMELQLQYFHTKNKQWKDQMDSFVKNFINQ